MTEENQCSDDTGAQHEARAEQEPLLKQDGIFVRAASIHYLMLFILVIILVGGASVGIWLLITSVEIINGGGGGSDAPFRLVNRSSWGATKPANTTPLPKPPATHVVIIHTDSDSCDMQNTCSAIVRTIQEEHMKIRKFDDIGYNFLVGGDGQTYEGRGWDLQGAFAKRVNNISLGIAFIGSFNTVAPPKQQLEETQTLLDVSVKKKKLPSDYILIGHRQVLQTDSPGQALYDIIKTWPHWKDCYMDTC